MQDKILFVTGATGIAASTALLAAVRGARIFVASLEYSECQALRDAVCAAGAECDIRSGDLAVTEAAEAAVEQCLARFGRIDAVWNVAGISGRRYGDGPLHECTDEGWDKTLSNNLRSMFLVNRAVLRHMLERRQGVILNMASVSAYSPSPKHFAAHAYAAAKGGVISMTKAMASYYAPHGIRVNAIAPGLVRTPMSRRAQQSPEIQAFIREKQGLLKGMIEPEHVAETALFLLSDAASAITGQVVTVDGGWSVCEA